MQRIHISHRLRNQLAAGVAVAGYSGLLAIEIARTGATPLGPLGAFTIAMVVGALTGVGLVMYRRGPPGAHFGSRPTEHAESG
jgi:hypothetical protein